MSDRSRRSTPRAQLPVARHRALSPALAAVGAVVFAACGPDPLAWDTAQERRLAPPPVSAVSGAPDAAADALVRQTVGELMRGPATPGAGEAPAVRVGMADTTLVAFPPDPGGTRCPASLRVAEAPVPVRPLAAPPAGHEGHAMPMSATPAAAGPGARLAAVWWATRPDRSAALYLSRTTDGGRRWTAPLAVDTLDRAEAGCDRPAPSVAVDSVNGYLHVAYSMTAPEGRGVFYAHQMDPRGPFERPQVIVYGDRPAATSVASAGDRVVVAYEDPNTGGRPFVSLALSRTAGHSWAERVPVSGGAVAAERPVVALRGADQVVLGWVERAAPRSLATTDDPRSAVAALPSGVVVRVGRLRP